MPSTPIWWSVCSTTPRWAGVSLAGTEYSYQNPLVNHGELHRWGWHGCPCCPPMLLKLYAGLGEQIYAHDRQDVFVNQYIGGSGRIPLEVGEVEIAVQSALPWSGDVTITLRQGQARRFGLHLRVPGWCPELQLRVNGQPQVPTDIIDGYAVLQREWQDGDTVELALAMPILRVAAHPFVAAIQGRVALRRGPLIYCVEGVDHHGASGVVLAPDPQLRHEYRPDLLGGIVTIAGLAQDGGALCAIPYYAWDNRRAADAAQDWMAVWLKQAENQALRQQLEGGAPQRLGAPALPPASTHSVIADCTMEAGALDTVEPAAARYFYLSASVCRFIRPVREDHRKYKMVCYRSAEGATTCFLGARLKAAALCCGIV